MSKSDAYDDELARLQLLLIRMQQEAMKRQDKVLIVFEGRDCAGKDGAIARLTEHLSRRETRIIALPKPSDRERSEWYFQRYAAHLPACGETVVFNRSWYNRAGVEPVMGFCTPEQHQQFLADAPAFERMLAESGVKLIKLWLDIGREEQAQRLKARREDPLKVFKVSPLDAVAQKKFDAYTAARDEMLLRTSTEAAPWLCVRADHKKAARLAIIQAVLNAAGPKSIARAAGKPDPAVLFPFETEALTDGRLQR